MEKIDIELKKALESKAFLKITKVIGVFIVVLIIFSAGVSVGFHKASFGKSWGEHYNENFGFGMRAGNIPSIAPTGMMGYFPNPHGTTGEIIKTELPNIIVEDNDNTEKSVLIGVDTRIQKGSATIVGSDLQTNDFVVVIGAPNAQGVLEAKLIRVLPNPELLK